MSSRSQYFLMTKYAQRIKICMHIFKEVKPYEPRVFRYTYQWKKMSLKERNKLVDYK